MAQTLNGFLYVEINTPQESLKPGQICLLKSGKAEPIRVHWKDAEGAYHEPEPFPPAKREPEVIEPPKRPRGRPKKVAPPVVFEEEVDVEEAPMPVPTRRRVGSDAGASSTWFRGFVEMMQSGSEAQHPAYETAIRRGVEQIREAEDSAMMQMMAEFSQEAPNDESASEGSEFSWEDDEPEDEF